MACLLSELRPQSTPGTPGLCSVSPWGVHLGRTCWKQGLARLCRIARPERGDSPWAVSLASLQKKPPLRGGVNALVSMALRFPQDDFQLVSGFQHLPLFFSLSPLAPSPELPRGFARRIARLPPSHPSPSCECSGPQLTALSFNHQHPCTGSVF